MPICIIHVCGFGFECVFSLSNAPCTHVWCTYTSPSLLLLSMSMASHKSLLGLVISNNHPYWALVGRAANDCSSMCWVSMEALPPRCNWKTHLHVIKMQRLHIHVIIAAINVSLDSSSIMPDQDALTCERMCEVSRLFLQLTFGRTGGTYW